MPAQDGLRLRRISWWVRGCWVVGMFMMLGCTRLFYRSSADRETYRIEHQRMIDGRWQLPARSVEADPRSRMGDPYDPDHEPIPPDDPAARQFQVTAGMPFEFHGWKKRGWAPIENPNWPDAFPRESDGTVRLDGPSAMRIAVLTSRDYQTQVENVYLASLAVTLARFQFFVQGFGGQNTIFRHFGAGKTLSNQLQLSTSDGFNLEMMSGAQLLTNFANQIVFQFNGKKGMQIVTSSLLVQLTQPLLQNAFARVVTQGLSLAERNALYSIRTFSGFRRQFYVNIVSGYLQLLTSRQNIRNQESNLEALKRNLDEQDALVRAGLVDPLQRDVTAQGYQQARSALLGQKANFQTQLDFYQELQLGLPPDFPLQVDESLLKRFELNDPHLDELRKENDQLYIALLQYADAPPREVMEQTARELLSNFLELQGINANVATEMERWQAKIEAEKGRIGRGAGPIDADERDSLERQVSLSARLASGLTESRAKLATNIDDTRKFLDQLEKAEPNAALKKLRELVGQVFRASFSESFVVQAQTRVHLIDVVPVKLTLEEAIATALANRQDLMNSQAQVTDAWRNVEVAGNQLLAGLNLTYTGIPATAPGHLGILRFDGTNNSQQVGVEFQAPINRRANRNIYRTDQILYQRSRRAYMLLHDEIARQIRFDLRSLNLNLRQFEIAREQILIATRQVEQAEYNARSSTGASSGVGQSVALALQTSLQSLLSAKNTLIGTWVSYEVQRMTLYRDFDTMAIDAQGVWTNDRNIPSDDRSSSPAPAGQPLAPPPGTPGPFAPQ